MQSNSNAKYAVDSTETESIVAEADSQVRGRDESSIPTAADDLDSYRTRTESELDFSSTEPDIIAQRNGEILRQIGNIKEPTPPPITIVTSKRGNKAFEVKLSQPRLATSARMSRLTSRLSIVREREGLDQLQKRMERAERNRKKLMTEQSRKWRELTKGTTLCMHWSRILKCVYRC